MEEQSEDQYINILNAGVAEKATLAEYTRKPSGKFEDEMAAAGIDMSEIEAEVDKELMAKKVEPIIQGSQKKQPPQEPSASTPKFKSVDADILPALIASTETPDTSAMRAIGNVGKGAALGLTDLVQGAVNGAIDLANWVDDTAAQYGYGSGDLIQESDKVNWSERLALADDDIGTRSMRAITRYAAPVVATMGIGGAGLKALDVAKGLSAGALSDFFLVDPKGERLADILINDVPEFKNFPIAYSLVQSLATKPDDKEIDSRFKNMIEGFFVGLPIAGGMLGISKFAHRSKVANKALNKTPQVMDELGVASAEAKMGMNAEIPEGAVPVNTSPKPPVDTNAAPKQVVDTGEVLEDVNQYDLFDYATTHKIREDGEIIPNLNNEDVSEIVFTYAKKYRNTDISRPPKDTAKLNAEARDILSDPKKFDAMISRVDGRSHSDAEVRAMGLLYEGHGNKVIEAAEKWEKTGADEDLAHYVNMVDAQNYLLKVDDSSASAAGAELRAYQANRVAAKMVDMPVSEFNKKLTAEHKRELVADILKATGSKEDIKKAAKAVATISKLTPEEAAKRVKAKTKEAKGVFRKVADLLHFTAVNGMLSSGKTVIANHASNAQAALKLTLMDNYMAAIIGTVKGNENARTWRQANDYFTGQILALGEASSAAWTAMKKGRGGPADVMKLDTFVDQDLVKDFKIPTERNLGYKVIGKVAEAYGLVGSLPTRLNGTADAFWGTVAYRGKLRELAGNEALARQLTGADESKFIKEFMKDPLVSAHDQAKEFAAEMTFSNPLDPKSIEGKFGRVASAPVIRTLVPFYNTTANVISYTVNNSPLGIMLPHSKTWNAIRQGGAASDMAMAKISSGTALAAVGGWAYYSGLYSGPDTRNAGVREALTETDRGWMPNSVRKGDTWYDISRLDYVNSTMRLGATLAAARNYLKDSDYQEYLVVAGTAIADVMTPEMMVETYGRMAEVLTDAIRGKDIERPLSNIAADVAGRMVPFSALARDVKVGMDPYTADTEIMRKNVGPLDEICNKIEARLKSQVPYFSEDLPVDRNMFYEPMVAPAGSLEEGWLGEFLSPFASRKAENTDLVKTLTELAGFYEHMSSVDKSLYELPISMPPRVIKFNDVDVELTPHEYRKFVAYSAYVDPETNRPIGGEGTKLRDILENLRLELRPTFNQPMNDYVYKKLVGSFSKKIREAREYGMKRMIADPDFMKRWNDQFAAKVELKKMNLKTMEMP